MGIELAQREAGAVRVRLKRAAVALAVASVFVQAPAQAARWTVTPTIRVQETWTNNVSLSEDGEEEWDLITEVEPGFFVRGEGDRLDVTLDYRALGLLYLQDWDRNRVDHRFDGKGTYEAVSDFAYLEIGGSATQQFESPFGAQPIDPVSDTDNRYTAYSYYVAPYLRGRIFGDSTYLLRYSSIWTNADQSSVLSDTRTDQYTGRFATPIRTFGLALTYDRNDTSYDDSPQELSTEISRAIGYWRLDPQFILNARVGYERVESLFADREEDIYGGGFQWFPTPRTSIEAYGERRVFGTGYLFSLQHRRPLMTLRARATRDPTTYPQNLFTLREGANLGELFFNHPVYERRWPDETERLLGILQLMAEGALPSNWPAGVPFFNQQLQILQRQEISLALTGARNTVTFTVYRLKTESFADEDDPTAVELNTLFGRHIDQRGASVHWSHRLTGRTRLNVGLYRTRVKEDEPFRRDSTQHTLRASVNVRLSPDTTAYVGARHVIFDADESVFHDYRETAVFVGFTHRF